MATEAEAHQARAEHSEHLRQTGAHAVGVENLGEDGSESFKVVAYYETQPQSDVPSTLEIERDGETTSVPLSTVIRPRGVLE